MKILRIVLPIAVGALIGYLTNYIAIKMLFLPRKEWYIGKWRVPFTPGVIPKNKSRVASAVANAVSEKLITENDIVESIKTSGIKETIAERISAFLMEENVSVNNLISGAGVDLNSTDFTKRVSYALSDKILSGIQKLDMKPIVTDVAQSSFSGVLSNPMVAMFLGGGAVDSICDKLASSITDYVDLHGKDLIVPLVQEEIEGVLSDSLKNNLERLEMGEDTVQRMLENVLDPFIENNVSGLLCHIDIRGIVEEKINQMDVKELENLVMSVMKNELQAIVNLGAIIGAVIGIINIFI